MTSNHVFDEILRDTKKQESLHIHNFNKLENLLSWMPTNRMIFSDLQSQAKTERETIATGHYNEKQIAIIHQLFEELENLEQDLSLFDLGSHFFQKWGVDNATFTNSALGKTLFTINQTLHENDIPNWTTRGIIGYYLINNELKDEPIAVLFANYFLNYNLAYSYPKSAMLFSVVTENSKNIVDNVHIKLATTLKVLWTTLTKYLNYKDFNALQKIALQRLFNIGYAIPFQQNEFQNLSRPIIQNLFTTGSTLIEKEENMNEIDSLKNQNLLFTHLLDDQQYAVLNLKNHNTTLYAFQNSKVIAPAMQQQLTKKETIGKIAGKAYFG